MDKIIIIAIACILYAVFGFFIAAGYHSDKKNPQDRVPWIKYTCPVVIVFLLWPMFVIFYPVIHGSEYLANFRRHTDS